MIEVLLIDDDITIKTYLEKYFRIKGYNMRVIQEGKLGIESFRQKRPDIVVLDLGLPDMTGEQVLPVLKEIDSSIPVIVLSGYREKKDMLLKMGANAYFVKPLLPLEIEGWINKIVEKTKDI